MNTWACHQPLLGVYQFLLVAGAFLRSAPGGTALNIDRHCPTDNPDDDDIAPHQCRPTDNFGHQNGGLLPNATPPSPPPPPNEGTSPPPAADEITEIENDLHFDSGL